MKKYLISFIFLTISLIANSCGWGPFIDVLRVQIFNYEAGVSTDYHNFYYSDRIFGPSIGGYSSIPQENIEEWYNFADKNVDKNDIIEFIYNYSIKDVENCRDSKNTDKYNKNTFCKALKNKNLTDIFNYIIYAKKIEKVLSDNDAWYGKYDIPALRMLVKEGKAKVENEDNIFLKQRYAYQVIVMLRYMKKYNEAIKYYKKEFEDFKYKNKTILKYWSLSHIATCQKKLGYKKTAQKNFLDVLYNSASKSLWVYMNLNKDYIETIKNQLTNEQYYSYIVSKNMHYPGRSFKDIKKLSKINQKHDLFKLLMIRELTKIEDWLLTKKYTGTTSYVYSKINYESDLDYCKKFTTFTKNILKNSDDKNKALWNLMLSHLYFLQKKYDKLEKYLKKSEKYISTKEEKLQYNFGSALLNIVEENDKKLAKDLNKIANTKFFNKNDSKTWINLIYTGFNYYKSENKHHKAALFLAYLLNDKNLKWNFWNDFIEVIFYLDKYANQQQVLNFIDMADKANNNRLYKFLLANFNFDKNYYLDLLGTMNLRKGNLKTALKYYKKINTDFWYDKQNYYRIYLKTNPFKAKYTYFNYPNIDSAYINKANFVEKLIEKRSLFENSSGHKKAKYAFELGNAYANMSYFGNNWYYVCYGRSIYGKRLIHTDFNTDVNKNYKECNKAFKYYDISLSETDDEKFKSKVYFASLGLYRDKKIHEDCKGHWYGCDTRNNKNFENPYLNNFEKELPDFYDKYFSNCSY